MKRVFLAVDVTENARSVIEQFAHIERSAFQDEDISWTRAANYHITVKFLGNRDDRALDCIKRLMERLASSWHTINVSLGAFQILNKRVLAIEICGDRLHELHGDVDKACAECDIETEKRSFSPHVTIGRVRRPLSTRRRNYRSRFLDNTGWTVHSLVLYESVSGKSGTTYQRLARFSFGA